MATHAFGSKFINKSGEVDPASVYSKGVIAIYFSAHWCPPCRGFTPVLAEFYEAVKASSPNDLEVVFVSSDSNPAQFEEYFKTMPWTAVPFGDPIIQQLKAKFTVSGIPYLVVCSPSGEVITTQGRADVTGQGPECVKKWLAAKK